MNLTTQRNCVVELVFRSTANYADPYRDVSLVADFAYEAPAPAGAAAAAPAATTAGAAARGVQSVPAFWAGEGTWVVRFAGDRVGRYRYTVRCSNPDDVGLSGTGTVVVEPYAGSNALLHHGRIRVAADHRHFEHQDGKPFFWMGDTWWMGLSKRLGWPEDVKALSHDRHHKGFNVVQIVAGPYPDMEAWDERGTNNAGHPFTPGFASVNPAYFDEADLKIAHLVHSELMPCIVGMWGYYLPQIGVAEVTRFWHYLIARYGAYPVVWCAAGEGTMPFYLSQTKEADAEQQRSGWSQVIRSIRETDAFGNLITIHPTQNGRDMVDDPSIIDFEMLQTGHGDLASVGPTIAAVRAAVKREPTMPVINAEVNYEGILGYAWQNVQRLCFWHSLLNGAAGHTYGANGIWQMGTRSNPYGASPHGRSWGDTPWEEAMHLPGGRQVARAGGFLSGYAWWQWQRYPQWLGIGAGAGETGAVAGGGAGTGGAGTEAAPEDHRSTVAVGIPGKIRVVYCAGPCWNPPTIHQLESSVQYTALYFDPVRGDVHQLGVVVPAADGTWTPPIPPECHDWVLVLKVADAHP